MDSASAPPLERGNNENASLEADDIDERMTEQALKDKTHREKTRIFDHIPDWAVSVILVVGSFIGYNLNIDLPQFKMKANGFGCFL